MYAVAKVLGQIFANPPYFILRCIVSTEQTTQPIVVKGKIPGSVVKGTVFTFNGKYSKDKNGKDNLDVVSSPINPKYLKGSALSSWAEWSDPFMERTMEIASTLSEAGVSLSVLNSLWKDLSFNPDDVLANPWMLVYRGVTFNSADEIAKSLLKDKYQFDHPKRLEASVFWSMLQGVYQGHSHLDSNTVFKDTSILTGVSNPQEIAYTIKRMKEADPPQIVVEDCGEGKGKALYLPSFYRMEVEVADLLKSPLRSEYDPSDIDMIKGYTRYPLTDTQIEAIQQGLSEPVSIITGLPGTGKTTILNTLCKILNDRGEKVLLVAPTGIAAKRASSLTGLEAMTIHRAFGAGQPSDDKADDKSDYEGVKKSQDEDSNPKPIGRSTNPTQEVWKYHPHSPRDETVVIVDEASMVDLHLMWRMMRGISPKCRLIMVGDIEQLPPVGAGFVLFDLIKSRAIPRIHLSEIFRQGEGSGVAKSAHAIHRGEVPQPNNDYLFVDRYSSQDILDTLVSTCKELQMDEVDFHVVSPTHHGKVGVTNLNRELRAVLNPSYMGGGFHSEKEIRVGKESIRVGDRVMVTKNEYDLGVFNGDIGKVQSIGRGSVDILIKGVQDQLLSLPMDAVGSLLRLAYATTVHKSQGLEYDVIVMPMTTEHSSNLLQRPLLYTAITRAKDKVILIGDRDAVAICVGNVNAGTKYSRLHHRF